MGISTVCLVDTLWNIGTLCPEFLILTSGRTQTASGDDTADLSRTVRFSIILSRVKHPFRQEGCRWASLCASDDHPVQMIANCLFYVGSDACIFVVDFLVF